MLSFPVRWSLRCFSRSPRFRSAFFVWSTKSLVSMYMENRWPDVLRWTCRLCIRICWPKRRTSAQNVDSCRTATSSAFRCFWTIRLVVFWLVPNDLALTDFFSLACHELQENSGTPQTKNPARSTCCVTQEAERSEDLVLLLPHEQTALRLCGSHVRRGEQIALVFFKFWND